MPKVYAGPRALCACCGKTTPVCLCSVAGPVSHKPGTVKIDHALLDRIFRDVAGDVVDDVRIRQVHDAANPLGIRKSFTYRRFRCPRCKDKAPELYWVETSAGNWVGAWCKWCLHRQIKDGSFGHPEEGVGLDFHILRLTANKTVFGTLEAWNESWHRVRPEAPAPEPDSDEGQLF